MKRIQEKARKAKEGKAPAFPARTGPQTTAGRGSGRHCPLAVRTEPSEQRAAGGSAERVSG